MKKIVATFGRFQSPTHGHKKLVDATVNMAKSMGADHAVFASHSHDSKRNPLPYDKKIRHLKTLFPHANIVRSDVTNPHHMVKHLAEKGYRHVTLVVGQDRVQEFKKQIGSYVKSSNKKGFDPEKHYDLDHFEVVSAGDRDPDASDVTGASGTKMRQFVHDDDFDSFAKNTPGDVATARKIFKDMKKHLTEEVARDEFNPMMDEFVDFASEKLGIINKPSIRFKDETDNYNSFAAYNPGDNEISISTANRHPMDIFRSLAHELVHHKQREDNRIGHDIELEGSTGSEFENEANSEAGKIMRWFAKDNPDHFDLTYVAEELLAEAEKKAAEKKAPTHLKAVFVVGNKEDHKKAAIKALGTHGFVPISLDQAHSHMMKKVGVGVDDKSGGTKLGLAISGRLPLMIHGNSGDKEAHNKISLVLNGLKNVGYDSPKLLHVGGRVNTGTSNLQKSFGAKHFHVIPDASEESIGSLDKTVSSYMRTKPSNKVGADWMNTKQETFKRLTPSKWAKKKSAQPTQLMSPEKQKAMAEKQKEGKKLKDVRDQAARSLAPAAITPEIEQQMRALGPGRQYFGHGRVGVMQNGRAVVTHVVTLHTDGKTSVLKPYKAANSNAAPQKKMVAEESEQLQELKRSTLINYVIKATGLDDAYENPSLLNLQYGRSLPKRRRTEDDVPFAAVGASDKDLDRSIKNRKTGIERAVTKITGDKSKRFAIRKSADSYSKHLNRSIEKDAKVDGSGKKDFETAMKQAKVIRQMVKEESKKSDDDDDTDQSDVTMSHQGTKVGRKLAELNIWKYSKNARKRLLDAFEDEFEKTDRTHMARLATIAKIAKDYSDVDPTDVRDIIAKAVNEQFEALLEAGGAGEWGTDELVQNYTNDTPGQNLDWKKDVVKTVSQIRAEAESLPPMVGSLGDNDGLGPTTNSKGPFGYGSAYSIPVTEEDDEEAEKAK